ncbi:MAG: molybdopterin-dependent oxidoreductase [Burkholderiales bacterium]|nr:molybdopterin-dependent oxidoreductase [Burkholderiales bacterium]
MQKRQFLSTSIGAAAAALGLPALAKPGKPNATTTQPVLLTVTGAISKTNRPAFEATQDILMSKQKLSFDKGFCFDFASLLNLPAASFQATLEYDGKPHTLSGPRLTDILQHCGIGNNADGERYSVTTRAIDGYAANFTLSKLRKWEVLIATHLDGKPMALGGLGPLWTVYDATRQPEGASMSLSQRFALCPWATYHIDVQAL